MSIINKKLRLQKNLLIFALTITLLSNLLLAFKLYNQEIITRNLPITDQELIISSGYINDEALKLKADQMLSLIFSMKKENVTKISTSLMRQVDSQHHDEFKAKIEILAKDIATRDYRYIFTDIQGYEFDNFDFTAKVKGYLETYLGGKRIDSQYKEYLLSFTNKSGLIFLKTFDEVKNDKNNQKK
jgi:hypothetical protein